MMPFEHGWDPDPAVVDAVIDGRHTLDTLTVEDRCVVVAALSERGESVEQIADRLGCCTRVVKRVRAQPLTRTLVRAERAEAHGRQIATQAARARSASGTVVVEATTRETQLKAQVDSLVDTVRRLRADLDRERRTPRTLHLWVYRRRPTPRQAGRQHEALF